MFKCCNISNKNNKQPYTVVAAVFCLKNIVKINTIEQMMISCENRLGLINKAATCRQRHQCTIVIWIVFSVSIKTWSPVKMAHFKRPLKNMT